MHDWEAGGRRSLFGGDEYRRRWRALQETLRRDGIAAAVLQQSRNVLYFGGIAVHGQVVIPADGEPTFLVQIDAERARQVSPLRVVTSRGVGALAAALRDCGAGRERVGIEKDALPVANLERLAAALPEASFADVNAAAYGCRMIKSPPEVDVLRRAAAISCALFDAVAQLARPGLTEIDLHARLAAQARSLGADGLMAKRGWNDRTVEHAWLVSGPNTAQVSGYWLTMSGLGPSPARPYGPTGRPLEHGDLLVYDVGTSFHGYHTDQARTYVLGRASGRQRRYRDALVEMQRAAIAAAVPGAPLGAPYEAARAVAQAHDLYDCFMTRASYDFPYVGHGVGLEIDEPPLLSPRTDGVFEPGMVVAIEPKIIVPGWGGLTLEDTVAVTASGNEVLTRAVDRFELGDGAARPRRDRDS
ncbi:MAG: aminopeptidase P family protein [Euzebyales bacterium]|nr:aminopeptidase P family protein [Euzebyales bacterium]